MMSFSFRNLYQIVSTDIRCRGRHRVTTGNFSMGEPPKCTDWVPRVPPLNSYGNQSYSRKTEGVVTLLTPAVRQYPKVYIKLYIYPNLLPIPLHQPGQKLKLKPTPNHTLAQPLPKYNPLRQNLSQLLPQPWPQPQPVYSLPHCRNSGLIPLPTTLQRLEESKSDAVRCNLDAVRCSLDAIRCSKSCDRPRTLAAL